ncbi:MAG: N-acetylneuraminate synthase family protein [Oscillospiraceae bacterium]|nr:N-acetylneuraminate synthase family protein [Oscillospiraceae bacterium]
MNNFFNDLFIFELANNHQGDVSHAEYIIKSIAKTVRKYNINAAVKFQYRNLDTLIHPDFQKRTDVKHIPRFYSTRLSDNDFYAMTQMVKEAGIKTMCTPFDEPSVELCLDHGIDILKVASCSAVDFPLLEAVAKAKKPIIISTGGKTFSDIDKIYNFFIHRNSIFALLHCVGMYPAKNEQIQLNCIERMINRFPETPIGYSGHESPDNHLIVQMAVAKGATIFERHIGHSTDTITLNDYSIEVDEVESWVEAVLSAKQICGNADKKKIEDLEIISMNELARGCYCAKAITKGEPIKREDVYFAMPCADTQTTSGHFSTDMIASRDYEINEALCEKRPVSILKDTRSIIHDVKGMLYEAKIIIGNDFELELSHHYGLEHFRNYGATIINIINREYCKKIIIVLPGQKNPTHMHKLKEETFQVLSGTLNLTMDEKETEIKAGEIVTIERFVKHSFTSVSGCIFEEISTTHMRNDSFYDDSKITDIDVMLRKTILKEW